MKLTLNRMIAYLIAGGFFFLVIEIRIEHNEVLDEKSVAFIPIIFSTLGMVIAVLAALRWQEIWIRILQVYLFLALAVGITGVYFHNEDRFEEEKTEMARRDDDPSHEKDLPPMLAPFAFVGLGAVGLLGTLRRWEAETKRSS